MCHLSVDAKMTLHSSEGVSEEMIRNVNSGIAYNKLHFSYST